MRESSSYHRSHPGRDWRLPRFQTPKELAKLCGLNPVKMDPRAKRRNVEPQSDVPSILEREAGIDQLVEDTDGPAQG